MKTDKNHFINAILIGRRLLIAMLIACVVCSMPAFSADNGCDNPDNDMISAELALCSTHAYNIGETQNPTGADRELMRNVVAMKTTLITQQMYKQYQQMESMLRRLKTQLEKAVLTTTLQAAGAKTDSSNDDDDDEFESNNRSIHVNGAQDCNRMGSSKEVYQCLSSNLRLIYDASGNGERMTTGLRKQLATDYAVAKLNAKDAKSFGAAKLNEKDVDCADVKVLSKKDAFRVCLDFLAVAIRKAGGGGGSSK